MTGFGKRISALEGRQNGRVQIVTLFEGESLAPDLGTAGTLLVVIRKPGQRHG